MAICIKVKCLVRDEGPSHPGGPILTQEGTRIINIVKQLITDTIIQFGMLLKWVWPA